MLRKVSFLLLITLGAALATAAAPETDKKKGGGPPAAGGPGQGQQPPSEVTFVTVHSRSLPLVGEYLGVLQASRIAEVRARIKGFIASRDFEEGATVKEGDVLYHIDSESYEADVEIARAHVQEAEAQVRLADSEVRRLHSLEGTGAVSQGDLDKTSAQLDQANANVRRAKADLSKSELELGYTEVKAPAGGVVGKTIRDQGALVDSAENSLLTQVWTLDPIYLMFGVSSRDYMEWKNKMASRTIVKTEGEEPAVQILLQDGTIYAYSGKQDFEDPTIDPTTGAVKVRAVFPNPDGKLKPGQFCKVLLTGYERPDTISLPQRAVAQSPHGASVLIIGEGNKLEPRPIKLGEAVNGSKEWIIQSGLKDGDRVMVDGFLRFPGTVVNPVPLPEPEAKKSVASTAENPAKTMDQASAPAQPAGTK